MQTIAVTMTFVALSDVLTFLDVRKADHTLKGEKAEAFGIHMAREALREAVTGPTPQLKLAGQEAPQ